MKTKFYVGMTIGFVLGFSDEDQGKVTQMSKDEVYIESDCFTGWVRKSELVRDE